MFFGPSVVIAYLFYYLIKIKSIYLTQLGLWLVSHIFLHSLKCSYHLNIILSNNNNNMAMWCSTSLHLVKNWKSIIQSLWITRQNTIDSHNVASFFFCFTPFFVIIFLNFIIQCCVDWDLGLIIYFDSLFICLALS